MVEVNIETKAANTVVARMGSAIETLIAEGGRSEEQAVTYAALKIAQSGRRIAKISRKNRQIVKNPEWQAAGRAVTGSLRAKQRGDTLSASRQAKIAGKEHLRPWIIERFTQRGAIANMPTWTRKDDRRVIQNRGLAKQSWNILVGRLGQSAPGSSASGKTKQLARQHVQLSVRHGSDGAAVHMRNNIEYMTRAFPGIAQKAFAKGVKALENRVKAIVERRVKKMNAI